MSHFNAKYPGICRNCSKPIETGQQISWSRKGPRGVYHLDCNNPNANASVKTATETASQPIVTSSNEYSATDNPQANIFAALASQIEPFIKSQTNREQVESIINEALAEFNPIVSLEIKKPNGEIKQIDSAHSNMPKLMYLVSKRHHTYLYGPPGSGKSTAAKQVADALELPYGYISLNPQTPDSRLAGYMDANGNYRATPFQQIYVNGGVFCIDEMDNASPSLLTTLNSGLENGHMAFPNGLASRHENFVLIATGNTAGRGANPMFPERRPFDAAFSERFSFIEWDYDLNLEKAITLAINPNAKQWLEWVVGTRQFCRKNYPRVLVTPRASFKGAEYLLDSGFAPEAIADMVVFKGLDSDTRTAILNANPLPKVGE